MRASHTAGAVSVTFDEPNLVSAVGLVPLLRLAERTGLHDAADRRIRLPRSALHGDLALLLPTMGLVIAWRSSTTTTSSPAIPGAVVR